MMSLPCASDAEAKCQVYNVELSYPYLLTLRSVFDKDILPELRDGGRRTWRKTLSLCRLPRA